MIGFFKTKFLSF